MVDIDLNLTATKKADVVVLKAFTGDRVRSQNTFNRWKLFITDICSDQNSLTKDSNGGQVTANFLAS